MNAGLVGKNLMPIQEDGLAVYMEAVQALHSDDPSIRRPAISALLELARRGHGAVRANAERALTREFGPYAVSEGLSGCSAPIKVVEVCDGNCRACVWLWLEPLTHASVVDATPDLQPTSANCSPFRAVA